MSGVRISPIGVVPRLLGVEPVRPWMRSRLTRLPPGGAVNRWAQPEDFGGRGGPALTAAIDRFEAARKNHPPTAGTIPAEIVATAARLVETAHQRLVSGGVTHYVDVAKGEIAIAADDRSALGRFATQLANETHETLVFNPIVLWRFSARASHNIENGVVYSSIGALANLKATQSEQHELVHARHNYRRHTLGKYSLFDGWLVPTSGHRLYENANYAHGFSLEELVTGADDAWAAGEGLRGATAALATGAGTVPGQLAERVREAARVIAPYQDSYGGPPMATKLGEVASAFERRLSSLGTPTMSVESLHYFYGRTGLVLRFAGSPTTVELVEERLNHREQSVVVVRFIDPDSRCHLSQPLFAADALVTLRRLVTQPNDPAAAMALLRSFLPPRLRALANVARTQTEALAALARSRSDLDMALTSGDRARMVAAGHAVEEALTRWRDTVNLDDGVEPRA